MEATRSSQSNFWMDPMNDEMTFISQNKVWDLVKLQHDCKAIRSKCVFKAKYDTNGQVERYKTRFVAKGFSKKERIDFKNTFSLVSTKD